MVLGLPGPGLFIQKFRRFCRSQHSETIEELFKMQDVLQNYTIIKTSQTQDETTGETRVKAHSENILHWFTKVDKTILLRNALSGKKDVNFISCPRSPLKCAGVAAGLD